MLKMKAIERISKRFKSFTLGTKVTILYAALFSIMLVSISVFIMINTSVYYRISSEQEIQQLSDKLVSHIESGGSTDQSAIDEIIGNMALKVTIEDITMRGIPLERPSNFSEPNSENAPNSPREKPNNFSEPNSENAPNSPHEKPRKINDRNEIEMIDGLRFMYHSKIAKYQDKVYLIEILRPYYHEQKTLRSILIVFICVNTLGIGFAFMIGKFISRKMLEPISKITQTANLISVNDLNQRLEIPEPDDEIKKLSVTFNNMISGIQESFEKQRQFVSDASHELRTPLSIIQGYTRILDTWGKDDKEAYNEAIDSIKDQTSRMNKLIEKLLFLARNDDNNPINMTYVDMNSVIDEIKRETEVMELTKESIINFSQQENIKVRGDYDLVKKLIWIFIENAVKYNSKERKCIIDVSLYSKDDKAYVKIRDNGIGIRQEDIPYIFDRFFRSDKSRGETQGTGLGLSIAKRIVERHSGKIYAESVFGKESTFTIELIKYSEH